MTITLGLDGQPVVTSLTESDIQKLQALQRKRTDGKVKHVDKQAGKSGSK